MRLEFHRQVASDISQIMDYYEEVAGAQLAEDFYAELRSFSRKQSSLLRPKPDLSAGFRPGYDAN